MIVAQKSMSMSIQLGSWASMVRMAQTIVPRRGAGVFRGVLRASGIVKKAFFSDMDGHVNVH